MIALDLRREIEEGRFERAEFGLLLPRKRTIIEGVLHCRTPQRTHEFRNAVCFEGIAMIIAEAIPTLYATLYGNDLAVDTSWSGSSFPGSAGELSGAEGYVEATRQEADLVGTLFAFVINTATVIGVRGVGFLTTDVKGDTTGELFSAAAFGGIENFVDGDEIDFTYTMTAVPT